MGLKQRKDFEQLDVNSLIDECLRLQQEANKWELKHRSLQIDANNIASSLAKRSGQYQY